MGSFGITHSHMPTLWPYVLKALTPPQHNVTTLDGNIVRMNPGELTDYVRPEKSDLVGIGGMTRTIHRSYAVADSVRARSPLWNSPRLMSGQSAKEMK